MRLVKKVVNYVNLVWWPLLKKSNDFDRECFGIYPIFYSLSPAVADLLMLLCCRTHVARTGGDEKFSDVMNLVKFPILLSSPLVDLLQLSM